MGKLGKLTPGNIAKSIESLTFLKAQLNNIPQEMKGKILLLAEKQAESLIFTLLKMLIVMKDDKSGFDEMDEADDAFISSLKAYGRLKYEKMLAYIQKKKGDIDINVIKHFRDESDKVGAD